MEKALEENRHLQTEFSLLRDSKSKELSEKNSEILLLQESVASKTNELNLIEIELQKIAADPSQTKEQTGSRSLWSHIDQLNRQLEEKSNL